MILFDQPPWFEAVFWVAWIYVVVELVIVVRRIRRLPRSRM